jgi:predicted O-linked N-acetylglucosamine transferase (SPINDLY family)
LQTIGLPQWIARDEEDYVERAIRYATDLPALSALRSELRERVVRSPLGDAPRFAAHLADAFERMWAARCGSATEAAQ